MRKIFLLLSFIAFALSAFYGCKKDDVTDPEMVDSCGIYLGVIGFNYEQDVKDISLLTKSNQSDFNRFIDNLTMGNGTGLYYADYMALNMLNEYDTPPNLKNVVLVTFTDGFDNCSLDDAFNPEHYSNNVEYREALHSRILTPIHGVNVSAYSIGLRGNDVSDANAFIESLRSLSSDNSNVYDMSYMGQVQQAFVTIASKINNEEKSSTLIMLVLDCTTSLGNDFGNMQNAAKGFVEALLN